MSRSQTAALQRLAKKVLWEEDAILKHDQLQMKGWAVYVFFFL